MKKILLTEDDPFLVRVYKTKLSKLNYEVKMIEDGNIAFETAKEFQPDLIILDIALKGKDGFTVIEQLKTDESTKNIPIFILSNLGMEEDIKKAQGNNIEKYIVKSSVDIRDVIEEIQKFLK